MDDRRGPARLSDREYFHLLLNLGNPIPPDLAARVCREINLSRRLAHGPLPAKVRQGFNSLALDTAP